MQNNPNSFDQELKDAQSGANPDNSSQSTEAEKTVTNPSSEAVQNEDYRKKFSESSKEALRLLEEKRALEIENERLRQLAERGTDYQQDNHTTSESLYPGFENLDDDAKKSVLAFQEMTIKKTLEAVNNDPHISFSRKMYNENKWDSAFSKVADRYPDLKNSKEEFKSKYFKSSIVPDNIENILEDVAKIHLFDKAKEIGAEDEKKKADRIDLERTSGGNTPETSHRTLEDWQRMAQENPSKFASLSKEFNSDMSSGRLKA